MQNNPKSLQGLPFDFDITMYSALQDWDNELWYREIVWRYRLFKKLLTNRELVLKHFACYSSSLGTFEEFIFDAPLKAKEPFYDLDSPVFFFKFKQYKIFEDTFSRVKSRLNQPKLKDAAVRFYTMGEALSLFDRHSDLLSDEYDYNHEQGAAEKTLIQPIHEVERASLLETECILKVDLSRTDMVLFAEFKKFIQVYRKQVKNGFSGDTRALKMELSKNKHVKWCDDKVIPYIDIMLWQLFTGQKPTDSQIINALESTDVRTTEKEALALLTPHAIRTLKMQI